MVLKQLCPNIPHNSVRENNSLRFVQVIKNNTFGKFLENFDFGTVGENIYRSKTVTNKPLIEMNRGETGSRICVY